MRAEIFALILGMTAVTYIPRAIPAVLTDKLHFRARVEKFLKLIPFTAMSALVFPSIFFVDESHPYIGVIGGLAAIVLAWRKLPLAVTVLGSIGAVMVVYLIGQ